MLNHLLFSEESAVEAAPAEAVQAAAPVLPAAFSWRNLNLQHDWHQLHGRLADIFLQVCQIPHTSKDADTAIQTGASGYVPTSSSRFSTRMLLSLMFFR